MSDAQDGRTYSGPIIGVVSHDGRTHALQKIGESQVIRHRAADEEKGQLEQMIGWDVTITCLDWHIGRVEDSASLRNQCSVGRGR